MSGIRVEGAMNTKTQTLAAELTETFLHSGSHLKSMTTKIPLTPYLSKAHDVPRHISYAGITTNLLADNDKKLVVWPYFEVDQEPASDELNNELKERYTAGNPEGRPELVRCIQKAQQVRPYVMRFLEEVHSNLDDIVDYLTNKHLYDKVEEKPLIPLADLHNRTNRGAANAGVICGVFSKVFGFSVWYLASARYRELRQKHDNDSGLSALGGPAPCSVCNL